MFFTREKIVNAFKKSIFPYTDGFQIEVETDEETDEKSMLQNEKIDTKNMPILESEKSAAEQRKKNKKREGLKILTLNQMLSWLQIT